MLLRRMFLYVNHGGLRADLKVYSGGVEPPSDKNSLHCVSAAGAVMRYGGPTLGAAFRNNPENLLWVQLAATMLVIPMLPLFLMRNECSGPCGGPTSEDGADQSSHLPRTNFYQRTAA